jgi:hypothetical protein
MKELVILRTQRAGSLPEGKGAYVEVDTNEGPRQVRFTYEDAEQLIGALHEAREKLRAERIKAGNPPLPSARRPERWETAIDPVEQQLVLRTHFTDGSVEQTQIPRTELASMIRSLDQALRRFEAGAEMRQ